MIATTWAWTALSIFLYGSSADRPEIKDDVDEVITSTSVLNISMVGLTTWYTCDKDFDHATHGKTFQHVLEDTMHEPTYHGLFVHTAETQIVATDVTKGKLPHCHFKHLNILHESSHTFAHSPDFISHTKFMVPNDQQLLKNFENLNKDMVKDIHPRCWDGHLFVGGYVLKDSLATGWYHVYNKYHKDFDACPEGESPVYTKWKTGRGNWLALPNHINQRSDRMKSPIKASTVENKGDVPPEMVGRWVTCNGKPDSFEHSKFTKIVEWPMDTSDHVANVGEGEVSYFFFQLYNPANKGALNEFPKALGKTVLNYDIQCRYQNLYFLKDSQAGQIQTTDSSDVILHTEYEIDTDLVANFLDITKAMLKLNKKFHKQTYLFTTTPYNGYTFVHFTQVFDVAQDLMDHDKSQALADWKQKRTDAAGAYVKLADGFSKNLQLNIID